MSIETEVDHDDLRKLADSFNRVIENTKELKELLEDKDLERKLFRVWFVLERYMVNAFSTAVYSTLDVKSMVYIPEVASQYKLLHYYVVNIDEKLYAISLVYDPFERSFFKIVVEAVDPLYAMKLK
ncbi:MAG: hypothetical protein QXH44_09235 [Pyrobaculum sp.]